LLPVTRDPGSNPQGGTFLTEGIVYFLNRVHCYNILEEYCYYEIQIHKALCEFAVEKGYCWLKEGLPPHDTYIREKYVFVLK
jgi:hypothetical protein